MYNQIVVFKEISADYWTNHSSYVTLSVKFSTKIFENNVNFRSAISFDLLTIRSSMVGRMVEANLYGMTVTAKPVSTRNSTELPLILQVTYNNFSEVLTPDTED